MNIHSATFRVLQLAIIFLLCVITSLAQRTTSLRGHVSDQVGAIIVGATVTLIDPNGKKTSAQTDNDGAYRFDGVANGVYTLSVQQKGFAAEAVSGLQLSSGVNTHDFQLNVAIEEQRVTVDDMRSLSTDPNSNKTARVMSGKDLNALSDDPNELAAQLDALAGPAAGPNGTQVFVDGFTASNGLPDKQTIREIVINQNPFSAEFERIGFGTIQVFTKPGTGKFHGGTAFTFSDAAFNSRNPYALNKPPYQRRVFEGNLSGPISKRSSFFFNGSRRDIEDTAVIAATIHALPLVTKSLRAAFEGVDTELEAAARTLGLGGRMIFFRVTLPLASRASSTGYSRDIAPRPPAAPLTS